MVMSCFNIRGLQMSTRLERKPAQWGFYKGKVPVYGCHSLGWYSDMAVVSHEKRIGNAARFCWNLFCNSSCECLAQGPKNVRKTQKPFAKRDHLGSILSLSRASLKAIYTVSDEEVKGGVRQVKNFSRLYEPRFGRKRGECVLLL